MKIEIDRGAQVGLLWGFQRAHRTPLAHWAYTFLGAVIAVTLACGGTTSEDQIAAGQTPQSASVQQQGGAAPLPPSPTPTATATPEPTPTATPIPTRTPIPDSDGDGLNDAKEKSLGTNPFQRDSDVDGLSDEQEVRIGSNPLFSDTDRDKIIDGDDIFPLEDCSVRVTISEFDQINAADPFGGIGDPYFKVTVGDVVKQSAPLTDTVSLTTPISFEFPVSDDVRSVEISVQAWDSDSFDSDDQYDIHSKSGGWFLFDFDRLGATRTFTGDGAADGDMSGPQAKISFSISAGGSRCTPNPTMR